MLKRNTSASEDSYTSDNFGRDVAFAVLTVIMTLVAHALAYLTHEYSHSAVAWALGWMSGPFAIDYGSASVSNVLFLGDVSDGVDYAPIVASGHGFSAAVIALAGLILGNGALYLLAWHLLVFFKERSQRMTVSFLYWLMLMCAGNVWGYVPLRAITTHADIAIAGDALHLSPWGMLALLIGPALYIVYHFFTKTVAASHRIISNDVPYRLVMVLCLTAFWFFSFFGGDGISGNYGLVSQVLCMSSRYLLLPIAILFLARRYRLGIEP